MSAQTTYNFATASGVIGGIYDLSPKKIITLINGEANGTMKFGVPVAVNEDGQAVLATSDTATGIIGITVNNRTTEMDRDGETEILKGAPIGVMTQGTVWVSGVAEAKNVGGVAYATFDADSKAFKGVATTAGTDIGAKFVGASADGIVPISINR